MNFCSFPFKSSKKRVFDDRPFSYLVDESKQKLISNDNQDSIARWVNCTTVHGHSDDDDDDIGHDFKSFNHYFDEPIYSEPEFKTNHDIIETKVDNKCSDITKESTTLYDILTITQGRYHCKSASSDSDYESFSVDKIDLEQHPATSGT